MRKKMGMIPRSLLFFLFFSAVLTAAKAQTDTIKQKKLLVFPIISSSIETGWSFGSIAAATFRIFPKDTISRTSNLEALFLYSTKKQLVTAINGTQYFHHEKYILTEQLSYSSFPDKFWGLGKYTRDDAAEPYKYRQFYLYAHLMRRVAPNFFIGVLFENQKVWDIEYQPGGAFDKDNVHGRQGYQVAGLGGSITYDKRNNAFSPDNGLYCQLYYNHFDHYLSSDYFYSNFILDIRKYIPTGKSVIALQFYSFNNTGEVPLRSLASFGGASRMRGYYDGRYKDQDQTFLQAEYRFPVYKRIGAVLFGGTGDVASRFSDYSLRELKYSYGGGIRFALNKKEKLNLRIDYGIGGGNNRGFYLQIGEAF
jgi:outer membrane protein assembly factor BamA